MTTASTQVMKAPRVIDAERRPPPAALLIAEAGAGVGALVAAGSGLPHWSAAAIAAAIGAGLLIPLRGTGAATRIGRRIRPIGIDRGEPLRSACCGGAEYAVARRGERFGVLIEVLAPEPTVAVLPDDRAPTLDLAVLARALELPDTPAAALTVYIDGARVPGAPAGVRADYDRLLGPITRWSRQRVTVRLEIDGDGCREALGRRCADEPGARESAGGAVAALAGRRLRDRLAAEGLGTRPVPADDPRWRWRWCPPGSGASPDAGVVTVDLEPAPEGVRLRLNLGSDAGHPFTYAGPASGHQLTSTPLTVGPARALAPLGLAVGGCGQVVGADRGGRAVAARLHGPGVRRVDLRVDDDWAVELVARAVATGARVLVVTAHPQQWEPLVQAINDPGALWLAGRCPPHPGARVPPFGSDGVVFLDGPVPAPEPLPAATVWWRPNPAAPNPAVPNPAVPNPAVPNPAVPDPAVPDPAVPDPATAATLTVTSLGPDRVEVRAGANTITATRVR